MSMSVVRGPCTGAAKPKISLKIRVAVDGKTVGDWGKLYDESVKLQIIIDWSIEKAADKSERTLTFQRVEACTSEEALDRCGTILDAEYLPESSPSRIWSGCSAAFSRCTPRQALRPVGRRSCLRRSMR